MIATWEVQRAMPHAVPSAAGGRDDGDPASWDADEAVSRLYSAHWRSLVRLAALLTGETAPAEEVVADAFVALHRRWSRLRDPQAAFAYLRSSVVNGSRSVRRHRTVEVRYRQPAPPDPPGPDETAVQADEDARLITALRRLPRRQQEVLVLRYYAEASEAEIADALGISRGAVKSHASRGVRALREALTEGGAR